MTSAPPPPVSEPDPSTFSCPGSLGSGCQRRTHKYGNGGMPLCQWRLAPVQENWGSTVRFTSSRP
ncbi:hypothetical protein OHB05_39155 [Streptomyces sp. NBC_00638]|uniref:hypothetical protein n=1 Tax=unclassified Streptomyces TaxID=2593676 RepID=UPI00225676BF|nr:hypothetical protein [Streptomyces sp. NBC_00638]MCX5008571.1 hypothetical protein [Streptomyces sp. NBC_00638]